MCAKTLLKESHFETEGVTNNHTQLKSVILFFSNVCYLLVVSSTAPKPLTKGVTSVPYLSVSNSD